MTDRAEPWGEKRAGLDAHERLAKHLSALGMGYPPRPELLEFLRTLLTSAEAEVALLLPTAGAPLEVISAAEAAGRAGEGTTVHTPRDAAEIARMLEDLAIRGLLFAGTTPKGERSYGLLQVGFGFPQTLFWDGGHKPESAAMADLVIKYFNREVTREAYGGTTTKAYRYVPRWSTRIGASAAECAFRGARPGRPGSPAARMSPSSWPPLSLRCTGACWTRRA